ncbi:hypothetical protein HanXRQr2_Chr06g0241051 [Helianthus annuus]|uniref:Uncharacterized protein n=1 Tax=Helianthus annuus TaxID=4232 RepID=A0A9K3NHW3_HELAN|nr:hypothetical protein HanXRQr2_Chr06g0241051 [Helianthus annuus]
MVPTAVDTRTIAHPLLKSRSIASTCVVSLSMSEIRFANDASTWACNSRIYFTLSRLSFAASSIARCLARSSSKKLSYSRCFGD